MIQADDEVFFLADARNITTVMSELRRLDSRPTRRLLIAGGGNIGRKLARNAREALPGEGAGALARTRHAASPRSC